MRRLVAANSTFAFAALALLAQGCQKPLFQGASRNDIREVKLVFDDEPWLNLDRPLYDPKPEGMQFRVLLIPGTNPLGVLRDDGSFRLDLYERVPGATGADALKLIADYEYRGAELHRSREAKAIGRFYFVRLHWMPQDLSGKEIELQVVFMPVVGPKIAAVPKRIVVPGDFF